MCSIFYHPICWKSIKDLKDDGPKRTDRVRTSDSWNFDFTLLIFQDFLGQQCFTPDCAGKIFSIRLYDEKNEVKIEATKEKKEKKSMSNKQKKKK